MYTLPTNTPDSGVNTSGIRKVFDDPQYRVLDNIFRQMFRTVADIQRITAQVFNGNVAELTGLSLTSDGLGYAVGSGGSVTQATDKTTTVVLNKASGMITTAADSLAATTEVKFTLTNSLLAATDNVIVNCSLSDSYSVRASKPSAGSCSIYIYNRTGGVLSEAIDINYGILKGSVT